MGKRIIEILKNLFLDWTFHMVINDYIRVSRIYLKEKKKDNIRRG
jgi:hypothetical protein